MDWRVKALAFSVLSRFPFQSRIRVFLQKRFGALSCDWPVDRTLSYGRTLAMVCRKCGCPLDGKTTMEIGTGWVPLIPVFFWLCGSRSCHTYDIDRLLSEDIALRALRSAVDFLSEKGWEEVYSERLEALKSALGGGLEQVLELCNIQYHAPADAAKTSLESGSVDVVFTNNVLEHVSPRILYMLFNEIRRLLSTNGVTVHIVDLSDHYSHSTSSTPLLNFLRYPEWQFRWINNRWLYQNRLRPHHYKELLLETGLNAIYWDVQIDQASVEFVRKTRLAPQFRGLSEEELCASALVFGARANS
jgi:hypothetical protein